MKIGILTLPLHTNYGGILQAYALQTVLERMGHEVEVLHSETLRQLPWNRKPFAYAKRVVKRYLLRQKYVRIFEEEWWNKYATDIEQRLIRQFWEGHLHLYNIRQLTKLRPDSYDAYVVGSDQVWRPIYFNKKFQSTIEDAYLDFADSWNVKRVAYAPSFGTEEWEYTPKQTLRCGELLRVFDAVSVRETAGVRACKVHFGVDAEHVLDPTLLLCADDYISLFKQTNTPKSPGTLLSYILDDNRKKETLLSGISTNKSLVPFKVNGNRSKRYSSPEEIVKPSVEQWLRGFYDAEFVVTDSFHACVFSILFKKQFVVYGNEGRGMARFHSLLSMFGLEDRLVTSLEQAEKLGEINYDIVYEKLEVMREKSMAFLENALN